MQRSTSNSLSYEVKIVFCVETEVSYLDLSLDLLGKHSTSETVKVDTTLRDMLL